VQRTPYKSERILTSPDKWPTVFVGEQTPIALITLGSHKSCSCPVRERSTLQKGLPYEPNSENDQFTALAQQDFRGQQLPLRGKAQPLSDRAIQIRFGNARLSRTPPLLRRCVTYLSHQSQPCNGLRLGNLLMKKSPAGFNLPRKKAWGMSRRLSGVRNLAAKEC